VAFPLGAMLRHLSTLSWSYWTPTVTVKLQVLKFKMRPQP
jgi:hypothetical protein